MKRNILTKAGFIAAIAGAAVIGGATTALVQAAIPSSNDGQIHACYRNSAGLTDPKGALKVIDSDVGASCASGETALKWPQSSISTAPNLKDSGGQTLGTVLDLDESQNARVFNATLHRIIPITYDGNIGNYQYGSVVGLSYESTDCSGLAYTDSGITINKTTLLRWLDHQNTTWLNGIVADNTSLTTKNIQSLWRYAGPSGYICDQIAPEAQAVYLVSEVSLPFTVPVTLPLKF